MNNIVLLVLDVVYVISGMSATEEVRQLKCAPESARLLVRSSGRFACDWEAGLADWLARAARFGRG